tara:strand:- start:3992 stop:4117 length:126 start_codon:yes stop_codon:yes gene_type:complete
MEGVTISIKEINMFSNSYNREKDKIVKSLIEKIMKEYIKDK